MEQVELNILDRITLDMPELPYDINEELKLLRTNLQFCGKEKKVICVTSAVASGDGEESAADRRGPATVRAEKENH